MLLSLEDYLLNELAKLLIEAEDFEGTFEGGELWTEEEEYEELYTQDIPQSDRTQNPLETKYRFVEIMLKETG